MSTDCMDWGTFQSDSGEQEELSDEYMDTDVTTDAMSDSGSDASVSSECAASDSSDSGIQDMDSRQGHGDHGPQCRYKNLSQKNLHRVPDQLVIQCDEPISGIDLSHNRLSTLPDAWGPTLNSLTELRLDGNLLTELPDSIGQLTELRILSAQTNKLISLPAAIGMLTKLQKLLLQKNRITCLPDQITGLVSLQELNLDDSELISLPESFGDLVSLTELDLTSNKLESLPATFGQLQNLSVLLLAENELSVLPDSFASLPSITQLVLTSNNLKRLNEQFASCRKLQLLCLDDNRDLSCLPDWIADMPSITKFSCRVTCLSGDPLPRSLGLVSTQLQELDLTENRITSIPDSVEELTELRVLNLGTDLLLTKSDKPNCNKLTSLPHWFGCKWSQLSQLRLANCGIGSLPNNFGSGLKSLSLLELSGNLLSSLPESMCLLSELQVLRLDGNRLQKLPDAVGKWVSLTELYLADNDLAGLPVSLFQLTKLRTLTLKGNRFTSYPGIRSQLPNLKDFMSSPGKDQSSYTIPSNHRSRRVLNLTTGPDLQSSLWSQEGPFAVKPEYDSSEGVSVYSRLRRCHYRDVRPGFLPVLDYRSLRLGPYPLRRPKPKPPLPAMHKSEPASDGQFDLSF